MNICFQIDETGLVVACVAAKMPVSYAEGRGVCFPRADAPEIDVMAAPHGYADGDFFVVALNEDGAPILDESGKVVPA